MASSDDSKHAWLQEIWEPTEEQRAEFQDLGMPPDDMIVAGFLMNNPLIFGVPGKAKIFQLAERTKENNERSLGELHDMDGWMYLRTVKCPLPSLFTYAHPPIGAEMGDIVEHNYNVRLQVVSTPMVLGQIKVISGSKEDDSPEIVFEGTDFPGPAYSQRVRVIRVTVHADHATYEVVADTKYLRFK